jgi:hypothetical protein
MAKKKPKPEETPEVVPEADDAPVIEDAAEDVDAAVVEAEEEADAVVAEADEDVVAAEDDVVAAESEESLEQVAAADDEGSFDEGAAEEAAALTGDAETVDEDGEASPPDVEVEEEEETPPLKPRVTGLTLVLCVLTLLAAGGAFVVVALDHGKRQEWSYAVFLNDLSLMGLPLEEEDHASSASRETVTPISLDPVLVNRAYQERKAGGKGGSEPFRAVDEAFAQRIRPRDIGPDTEKLIFAGLGEPVKTLEDEVERVKRRLPADIDAAAQEAGKDLPSDAKRQELAAKLLLPLAHTPFQIEALGKRLKAAKGADLNTLLVKGAKLKMLADLLGPLEEERPLGTKNKVLQTLADLDNPMVADEAQALLIKRVEATRAERHDPELAGDDWAGKQRTSMDKRQAIAFLLYAISQLKKPDGQPLYPKGLDRTAAVVGLLETTYAADSYALALRQIQDRVTRSHEVELGGYRFADGDKIEELPEFAQKYPEEIKNIQDLRAVIANRTFRLKELQEQVERHKMQLKDRQEHYDGVSKQLLELRAETARLVKGLERLQREYFLAQRRLAEAAEINRQKEQEIRYRERAAKGRNQ